MFVFVCVHPVCVWACAPCGKTIQMPFYVCVCFRPLIIKYPSNSICTKYTRHEAATETDLRSDTEGHVKEMFVLLGNDQKKRGGRRGEEKDL